MYLDQNIIVQSIVHHTPKGFTCLEKSSWICMYTDYRIKNSLFRELKDFSQQSLAKLLPYNFPFINSVHSVFM